MRNPFARSAKKAKASQAANAIIADNAQTLAQAEAGCNFRITAVQGNACKQLRDMGFCESMEVKKLTNGRNMLCTVCGAKLALNRKLADQILVCPA